MRKKPRFLKFSFLFAALLGGFLCRCAFAESENSPIQVHGDTVEYFQNENKAVGTGHVVVDYEGDRIEADKITVYTDKKTAYAEGNVVLTQKGSVYRGPTAEYNFQTKSGSLNQMKGELAGGDVPYYTRAAKVERVSEDHFRLSNASITTCCSDVPFYKLQGQRVDIYPDDRVEVRNALMMIKNVPVLFLPFYSQKFHEIRRLPVQIVPGHSGDWGAFVLSKWRYQLLDTPGMKMRGNILADYRSKRGFGYGVENYYTSDVLGRGVIKAYASEDKFYQRDEDSTRERYQVRHQMRLTPDTVLTAEFNKLSDQDVIKDYYYREEYEQDQQPDDYVSVVISKPEYTLSFLERYRMNNFYTVVRRNPEIRFDTYNKQFKDTPFYLRQEFLFSNLQKEFAGQDDSLDATRVDQNYTLSYAGHIGNFSVTPRVGTRQTYYSADAQDEGSRWRGTFDPGLDISTRFYKVYDVQVRALGMDYNQIRHIFTPTVSFNYRPNPTSPGYNLLQYDRIDALDKQSYIRFNFINKFQTKEHAGPDRTGDLLPRDLARIVPFFDMDYTTDRPERIGFDSDFYPYKWMGISFDGAYDSRLRAFSALNSDVYVNIKKLTFSVGHRYNRRDSSQITASVEYALSPEWSFGVYTIHEFKEANDTPGLTQWKITRNFECVAVDFIWSNGQENELFIAARVKGFEGIPFQLEKTYRRPRLADGELRATPQKRF